MARGAMDKTPAMAASWTEERDFMVEIRIYKILIKSIKQFNALYEYTGSTRVRYYQDRINCGK